MKHFLEDQMLLKLWWIFQGLSLLVPELGQGLEDDESDDAVGNQREGHHRQGRRRVDVVRGAALHDFLEWEGEQ